MTAGQHIDYEALAQDAMRGVVRAVLTQVAESGLNGDHHFYIAFNTQAPGVTMSKRLREKYPVEMTIVLQHRFWDLEVNNERFEVKLTFDGIPERLVIPFRSVKVFYDPSVPYGLQFEESELTAENSRRMFGRGRDDADGNDTIAGNNTNRSADRTPPEKRRAPRRPRTDKSADQPPAALPAGMKTDIAAMPGAPERKPAGAKPQPVLAEVKPSASGSDEPKTDDSGNGGGAKVVDISKFRKK